MPVTMEDSLRCIKGVGEARAKLYQKLGIATVGDLLYHLPRSYIDLRSPYSPEAAPIGQTVAVLATLARKSGEQRIRKGFSIYKVQAVGGGQVRLDITFFNARYTVENLRTGEDYIFYGRVDGTLLRREMQSPAVYPGSAHGLMPIYPATAGLTSRMIAANAASALAQASVLPETLTDSIIRRYGLMPLDAALRELHHPAGPETLEKAKERMVFEELLCLALGLSIMRRGRSVVTVSPMTRQDMQPFYSSLPFTPTSGQRDAIEDSMRDMCSGRPMNRLVQGDVGSGKTLVAAACCYFAWKNGLGSAMMAPTELLAEQHYRTMRQLLSPLGMRVGLLTGSMTPKEKKLLKQQLAAGELDFTVGTHALITQDAVWSNLGLVITDEQHRFGVAQRMSLTQKGRETHTLIMSATPIPRTLGLIAYGDMELSIIRELPSGRQPVETFLIDSGKRQRAFGYIRKHLDRGLQGFVVCPLVQEDEEQPQSEKKAAAEWMEQLSHSGFSGYRLGLLHGKMKPRDKDAVMASFAAGELDLLVSTTVVEVGIDVPNAAIMMIENAESFGLSQLHQLRGRVGRGKEKSTCILLSDSKDPVTLDRLKTLCRENDGFAIAEYDLSARGPGDFFGLRQHGIPQLRVASLSHDLAVLEQTRTEAERILANDSQLTTLPLLQKRIDAMMTAAAVL